MLNDNELRALIEKAQRGSPGDRQAAADTVIEHNLNLVRSVAVRFANRGYEWDDLFQIGSIGLLKSVKRFDLTMGVKFSTYAVPMIIGEIKRFIRDDGPVKISRSIKELAQRIYKTRENLQNQTGREPTIGEIALELSLPSAEIAAALEAVQPQVSLYESSSNDNGGEVYIIDKIGAGEGQVNEFIDKLSLNEALGKLPDRERNIVFLRFFADKTQSDIAKMMGLSQVQVSRIEKAALKLLRNGFADVGK